MSGANAHLLRRPYTRGMDRLLVRSPLQPPDPRGGKWRNLAVWRCVLARHPATQRNGTTLLSTS